MAITKEKVVRADKMQHAYEKNTVQITIKGKKCRVNKFEVDSLKAKMKNSEKFKK